MNKWISVEERLPKKGGRYLAYNGYDVEIVTYDKNNKAFEVVELWLHDWCWTEFMATHWMPLPKLPKERT